MSDPLICEGRPLVRRLASLYPRLIQGSGTAWGAIYHASNTRAAFAALRGAFGQQVGGVILAQLKRHDVDLVVSVHPLLNHVALAAIRRSGRPRGLVTVVTDLLDLHRGWACRGADLVTVPSELAGETVRRLGVPEDRLRVLGLPVDLRFRPPAPGEKQALRRRWGLDQGLPTVLVLGGGEGSGKLLQQVRALAWGENGWQVIAVCGRNETLRRRLARVRFATPILVLGFVDFMPALIRASDLVVTKAGPGAIAEALATGVPLVLTGYLRGQETANVRFVTDSGFGLYAPRPDELKKAVGRLLGGEDGGEELKAMAGKAAAIARPYASLDIARECVAVAERYRTGGAGAPAEAAEAVAGSAEAPAGGPAWQPAGEPAGGLAGEPIAAPAGGAVTSPAGEAVEVPAAAIAGGSRARIAWRWSRRGRTQSPPRA